ncbi:MAG: type II toxin-antitoxin system HicA family toxin [Planctomycetota bacterium]|nr:type II toxin-antitoxin system HicA family toxin [Planctomycetota bacterium]
MLALERDGFVRISQRGSHLKLKRYGQRNPVIIPIRDQVARGTLKSILEQAGISLERFLELF